MRTGKGIPGLLGGRLYGILRGEMEWGSRFRDARNKEGAMAAARILLVDDNPVNLSVLRAMLGREDYELIGATSGQSAQDLVEANPNFDLILLDVAMPDINGIEVCRQLRNNPATEHIPIVLLSAVRKDDESISQGLAAGADGYLTKPIDECELRTWVKATLRISALERKVALFSANDAQSKYEDFIAQVSQLSHPVNNALQAVCANAELLALQLENSERGKTLVSEIVAQVEKAATLVTQTSVMARQVAVRRSDKERRTTKG